jgi:surfeit locus 1 family protein
VNADRRFWLLAMAALLGLVITLLLGRWQLSRAAQKEAVASAIAAQATLPALTGSELATLVRPQDALYRRAQLRGRWLSQHTVFLDNRQMEGRQGLYVITPLALEDSDTVLLVQRGWVPRNFLERSSLPQIATVADVVSIAGRMAPPPGKLYELGPASGGRIRQNLDIADYARESGLLLWPVSVQQTDGTDDGLLRTWPRIAAGVEKHHGYAFQWFGLSALIAVLYVWFQIVRPLQTRRR